MINRNRLVIILLTTLWLSLSSRYLIAGGFALNSLDSRYTHDYLVGNQWKEILQGRVISGFFTSKFPNLGTVGIRFDNLDRINDDELEFRIKDLESEGWDYTSIYKTDQFQKNLIFPFGFPLIENSQGNSYYFEIESLHGATGSAVKISSTLPTLIARSVFEKNIIFKDPKMAIYFASNKLINVFGDSDFRLNLIIYSLPLLIYLVFHYLGQSLLFPVSFTLMLLIADILTIKSYYVFLQGSILFSWAIPVIRHKAEPQVSTVIAITSFILAIILMAFGADTQSEKAAFWTYVFVGFSFFQLFSVTRHGSLGLITVKEFWAAYYMQLKNSLLFIYLIVKGEIVVSAKTIEKNITGDTTSARFIALMISRLGEPVIKTYLISSRIIAYSIIGVVKLIKAGYLYGPYAFFVWLGYLLYKQIYGYLMFYRDFFVENQSVMYWNQAGKYFFLIGTFSLFIFFLIQRKKNLQTKCFIAIILIIIVMKFNAGIFDNATPYRENIKIWSINPQESGEPWVDVTVRGRNFGEMPFKGKVIIEGEEQRVISWSGKEITFRTNPLSTRSGFVIVKTAQGKESDTHYFTYTGNR